MDMIKHEASKTTEEKRTKQTRKQIKKQICTRKRMTRNKRETKVGFKNEEERRFARNSEGGSGGAHPRGNRKSFFWIRGEEALTDNTR